MPLDSYAQVGPQGVELVQSFEGIVDGDPRTVNLDPYLCPANVWTIGWGHAVTDERGNQLRGPSTRDKAYSMFPGGITREQAVQLLQSDLIKYANMVIRTIGPEALANHTTQAQFDAMVSLCYNIGGHNFETSRVARFHQAGLTESDATPEQVEAIIRRELQPNNAADAFLLWTKAAGRTLPGLVRRRRAEREVYISGDLFS